jgi:hypothetical protein
MLAAVNYAPLLRTKPAEITAFHTLSAAEKSTIFPIFLAKPWQNAAHFQKTLDKVAGAAGGRPFGLAMDRQYLAGDARQPAQAEFDALFDSNDGFRVYFECLSNIDNAVPVLTPGGSTDQIMSQLANADALGRGLIVRFTRGDGAPILNSAGANPPLPHDTVFVVDAGWGRDSLQLTQWATNTVQSIVSEYPGAEIIVMASTFPDSFSSICGHGTVDLFELEVFSSVRSNFNEARIVYGDWATTRPPQTGGGGTIPPRIDIPMLGLCNIFRANEEQTYSDMAGLAMAHPCFSSVPECYGRILIEQTSDGLGITGTQRPTEARINIHLVKHSAAPYKNFPEEEYID